MRLVASWICISHIAIYVWNAYRSSLLSFKSYKERGESYTSLLETRRASRAIILCTALFANAQCCFIWNERATDNLDREWKTLLFTALCMFLVCEACVSSYFFHLLWETELRAFLFHSKCLSTDWLTDWQTVANRQSTHSTPCCTCTCTG